MKLEALPAFSDNYIWRLHDGRQAIVVDPGDAAPVQAALDAQGLALDGILVTHHDVGGLGRLRPGLHHADGTGGQVCSPALKNITTPFVDLKDGDSGTLMGLTFEVLDVTGHTAGQIACVHRPSDGTAPVLFCSDTLFSGACGHLFEGRPAQMHDSLARLAALPGATRVYCAHEYTASNLSVAVAVGPANAELAAAVPRCQALRAAGQPTLPSSIAFERAINPFKRCDVVAVIQSATQRGAADTSGPAVLGVLREWKNNF